MNAAGVKVNIGKNSEVIFGKDMAEHTADFLRQELGEDSVAKYAFARSCETHRIAREKGKQAVRFCPLMIRLGAAVLLCHLFCQPCTQLLSNQFLPNSNPNPSQFP